MQSLICKTLDVVTYCCKIACNYVCRPDTHEFCFVCSLKFEKKQKSTASGLVKWKVQRFGKKLLDNKMQQI